MQKLLLKICNDINFDLKNFGALAGGDINQVFLITSTNLEKRVLKLNKTAQFPDMFKAEAKGLQLLKNKSNFVVPEVLHFGAIDGYSYLIIEHIEQGNPGANFSIEFGKKLAELHQNSNSHFGLNHANYIGSLPQKNPRILTAKDFYVYHRLAPQFSLALKNGFEFKNYRAVLSKGHGCNPR